MMRHTIDSMANKGFANITGGGLPLHQAPSLGQSRGAVPDPVRQPMAVLVVAACRWQQDVAG
jgi:hypothetical protein